jgi:hypothetical protein
VPPPESSCALEADCVVGDILNRKDAVRVPLAKAGRRQRLVESLASIWEEERTRLCREPPLPPPSPRRHASDVCSAVTAARVDFERVIAEVRPHRKPGHLVHIQVTLVITKLVITNFILQ